VSKADEVSTVAEALQEIVHRLECVLPEYDNENQDINEAYVVALNWWKKIRHVEAVIGDEQIEIHDDYGEIVTWTSDEMENCAHRPSFRT